MEEGVVLGGFTVARVLGYFLKEVGIQLWRVRLPAIRAKAE